jgi:hypothetical protein
MACSSTQIADEEPATVQQRFTEIGLVEVSVDPVNLPETLSWHQSEQSVVLVNQGGEKVLLAAYNDFTQYPGDPDATNTRAGWATSTSVIGIPSWTPHKPIPHGPDVDSLLGDPWLAVDTNTHQIVYYVSLARKVSPIRYGMAIAKSTDGGKSWAGFRFLGEWQQGCAGSADKPSVAVDATGTEVYVAYVCEGPEPTVHVLSSHDGGGAWRDVTVPDTKLQANAHTPSPIVQIDPLNQNRSYVSIQHDQPQLTPQMREIVFTASDDRGATYGPPVVVTSEVLGDAPFRGWNVADVKHHVHQSFAVDPWNGHCFIAYENGGRVNVKTSTNGANWSSTPPPAPDTYGKSQFQPVIYASRSMLALAWYEQADGTNPTWIRASFSPRGGAGTLGTTWQSYRSSLFLFGQSTLRACAHDPTGYFGDYIGLTSLAFPNEDQQANEFYLLFTDSRRGLACTGSPTPIHQHTSGILFTEP